MVTSSGHPDRATTPTGYSSVAYPTTRSTSSRSYVRKASQRPESVLTATSAAARSGSRGGSNATNHDVRSSGQSRLWTVTSHPWTDASLRCRRGVRRGPSGRAVRTPPGCPIRRRPTRASEGRKGRHRHRPTRPAAQRVSTSRRGAISGSSGSGSSSRTCVSSSRATTSGGATFSSVRHPVTYVFELMPRTVRETWS